MSTKAKYLRLQIILFPKKEGHCITFFKMCFSGDVCLHVPVAKKKKTHNCSVIKWIWRTQNQIGFTIELLKEFYMLSCSEFQKGMVFSRLPKYTWPLHSLYTASHGWLLCTHVGKYCSCQNCELPLVLASDISSHL